MVILFSTSTSREIALYLKRKFPELADKIIALAEYMLCEGNIMSYYEDWADETYPYANVKLNSQQISRVFQGIVTFNSKKKRNGECLL